MLLLLLLLVLEYFSGEKRKMRRGKIWYIFYQLQQTLLIIFISGKGEEKIV